MPNHRDGESSEPENIDLNRSRFYRSGVNERLKL